MATTVGKLRIILTANAGRFQRTMKGARKSVAMFSKSAGRFALKIGGIGIALAALAAGGGFVALLRNTAKAADNLAKTSAKLGTTTEGLAGLRLAAKLSGVEVSKLQMAIQRMTRRISEAAIGTGEAKDAIKELGLNAVELNKLKADEKFLALGKAIAKVQNPADRLRFAFKLLDSEGVDLINTWALGGEELQRLNKLVKRLGTGINRIDAKKIELMNDSFTLLREAVSGLFTQINIQLAPVIEGLSTAFFNAGTDGIEMAKVVQSAFRFLARNIISVIGGIDLVVSTAFLSWELEIRKRVNNIVTAITSITLIPGGSFLLKALGPVESLIDDNATAVRELQSALEGIEKEISDKYLRLINALGDMVLEFDRKARAAASRIAASIDPSVAGISKSGATIRGRTGAEGLIRAGGIVGVQKLSASHAASTAKNTAKTVTLLERVVTQIQLLGGLKLVQ